MIWSAAFWKGAAERAIKTLFQTLVAVVAVESVGGVGIHQVSWWSVLSVAALAAVLSLATSIGNAEFTAGVIPDPPVSPPQVDTQVNVTIPPAAD